MSYLEIFRELGFPIGVAVVSMAAIWSVLFRVFNRHLKLVDKLETALEALVKANTEQNHAIELLHAEVKSLQAKQQE